MAWSSTRRRSSGSSTTWCAPATTTPPSSPAYRAGVGMSAAEVAAMRALPTWSARVATVPTIPREFRTAAELAFDSSEHRALDLPTVLLLGEQSTPGQKDVVARIDAALSHSKVVTLPGQAHAAQVTAPWLQSGDRLCQPSGGASRPSPSC